MPTFLAEVASGLRQRCMQARYVGTPLSVPTGPDGSGAKRPEGLPLRSAPSASENAAPTAVLMTDDGRFAVWKAMISRTIQRITLGRMSV